MTSIASKISAGFLLRSQGHFLLCHATKHPKIPPKQFDGAWTISKGLLEANEHPISAATRELREETNIDLHLDEFKHLIPPETCPPLTSYHTSGGKQVMVFFIDDIEGKIKNSKIELKCTSLIEGAKQAYLNGLPEMDGFMWVSNIQDCNKMVFKSQKFLFEDGFLDTKLKELNLSQEKK